MDVGVVGVVTPHELRARGRRISDRDVAIYEALVSDCPPTMASLAEQYDVDETTIGYVVRRLRRLGCEIPSAKERRERVKVVRCCAAKEDVGALKRGTAWRPRGGTHDAYRRLLAWKLFTSPAGLANWAIEECMGWVSGTAYAQSSKLRARGYTIPSAQERAEWQKKFVATLKLTPGCCVICGEAVQLSAKPTPEGWLFCADHRKKNPYYLAEKAATQHTVK